MEKAVALSGPRVVLTEADAARSLPNGHIVLSRQLAAANYFRAIAVLDSVSRLSEAIAFRFPLDPYLALLRREMEAAEAKLAELRAKQQAARRHSDELLQQRQAALERLAQAEPLDGVHLRGLDSWRTSLAENAIAAQNAAGKLDGPIQQAKMHALEIKRRVDLLGKLREQRLSEHQRLGDRQIEQPAAELHLAARHGRSA